MAGRCNKMVGNRQSQNEIHCNIISLCIIRSRSPLCCDGITAIRLSLLAMRSQLLLEQNISMENLRSKKVDKLLQLKPFQ